VNIKTVAIVALLYLGQSLASNVFDAIKGKVSESKLSTDLMALVALLYGQKKDEDDDKKSSLKDRMIDIAKSRVEQVVPALNSDNIDLSPDKILPMIFDSDDLTSDDSVLSSSTIDNQVEITALYSTAIWCQLPNSIGEYQQEGSKLLVSNVVKPSTEFGDMFGFILNGAPYKAQVGHWRVLV